MAKKHGSLEVVILAAGKGTRMKSRLPKVLHRVCGRTLLNNTLRAAAELKPERLVVVLGFEHELVQKEIDLFLETSADAVPDLRIAIQTEQLGTGHAVQVALGELSGSSAAQVLILPGDCPLITSDTLKDLSAAFSQQPDSALAFLTSEAENSEGLGRIVRNADGEVQAIVEETDCTEEQRLIKEVNSAIYAVEMGFLSSSIQTLTPANAQAEFYLTDIVEAAVKEDKVVQGVRAKRPLELAGANSRFELSLLEKDKRASMLKTYMEEGVSFEDPTSTYIDEGVTLGRDVFIGAGTRILGRSTIADGVVIEGDCRIQDCTIGADSHIRLFCYMTESQLGAGCVVGPFAQLRPGSVLEDDVKIGNFVETKKTVLAQGAKANHLSYLGDTEVGERVNIGAGTITCNYDGYKKYNTIIEEGAFIGSNTCLIAPVTVGANAVVGAGSAIAKDVPKGSLGLERSKQSNFAGWADKKRKANT